MKLKDMGDKLGRPQYIGLDLRERLLYSLEHRFRSELTDKFRQIENDISFLSTEWE